MNELIAKLHNITDLSMLENLDSINPNVLLLAIAKSGRFSLLNGQHIKLNINDISTFEEFIDFLISNYNVYHRMKTNGFLLSKDEKDIIFNLIINKYKEIDALDSKIDSFIDKFFDTNEELDDFVDGHKAFFTKYVKRAKYIGYPLNKSEVIIGLMLQGDNISFIRDPHEYSLENMKKFVLFLKRNKSIPSYYGYFDYAKRIFELKDQLTFNEFYELLSLLKEKHFYDKKNNDSNESEFTTLIRDNIDYLFSLIDYVKLVPKCLIESEYFRDECIKRNRIDLAVKCVLSPSIMQDETLIKKYCQELKIDLVTFYKRSKWITNYYKKNNDIFNTILATSFKDEIFNIKKDHFERFINDVEIEMKIARLNDKELLILSKILDIYDYQEYDICLMIINVIENIPYYNELINSLNIDNIKESDLRKIVSVLQLPDNQYQIKNLSDLDNYFTIKKQAFSNTCNSSVLITNKDSLLKTLFNVDIKEAKYIIYKYCQNNNNENILNNLKNSELPKRTYDYLVLINKIVECNNSRELIDIYQNIKDSEIYDKEIPLEAYLRSEYTKLYSQSLYRIKEKEEVYGPVDNITDTMDYHGIKVKVCIPRVHFNFFIHCVGSCSIASDVIDKNYKVDWLDRPQIQDHFIACSYIDEMGLFSTRSDWQIVFGFDKLEGSAILGMGNTDIDSISPDSRKYNGSRLLQESNKDRAKYYIPSELLKNTGKWYNEVVIERRNINYDKDGCFKRKPDYIIMMVGSMEHDNFNYLDDLYREELSFVKEEDREQIKDIGNTYDLKKYLKKYREIIVQLAESKDISIEEMEKYYVNLIIKAKYYENCLKAASEFDIPLIIVDKAYYFSKALYESGMYDKETIQNLIDYFVKADNSKKHDMYFGVINGKDVIELTKPKESIHTITNISC